MFKISNIPNFLTILRILLIPGIIVCIEINEHFYSWIGLIFYIIACFSDFLDGFIARKFDFESNFLKVNIDTTLSFLIEPDEEFTVISSGTKQEKHIIFE